MVCAVCLRACVQFCVLCLCVVGVCACVPVCLCLAAWLVLMLTSMTMALERPHEGARESKVQYRFTITYYAGAVSL